MEKAQQTPKQQKGILTVTFDNGDELQFEVNIVDSKWSFGRTNYLVTPVAGSGQAWKAEKNIKLLN